MSDFYVGYLPTAPDRLRAFLRTVVRLLLISIALLALTLVKAQKPFAASAFEFAQEREFDGTIESRPYPTLLVPQPGTPPTVSRYLLVAPGKHGADALVREFSGEPVHLRGKLIYRREGTMIEVAPDSLRKEAPASPVLDQLEDLGVATLTGEIVDTKCFLGVMNPGEGKVHRECAARCLSGGVPAGFLVSPATGESRLYILVSADGGLLPRALLVRKAGERVTISGRIVRVGTSTQFRIAPGTM